MQLKAAINAEFIFNFNVFFVKSNCLQKDLAFNLQFTIWTPILIFINISGTPSTWLFTKNPKPR